MGLGPGRVVTLNTPNRHKGPGVTWLFAQASFPAGSHFLGQSGLSWALRTVQSEVLAVHYSLETPEPSYLPPLLTPAPGTVPDPVTVPA